VIEVVLRIGVDKIDPTLLSTILSTITVSLSESKSDISNLKMK
jgi:hypothetical protein